jgi:hypothetical protein
MSGSRRIFDIIFTLGLTLMVLLYASGARADEPGPPPPVAGPVPDKSDNTVFKPVPAQALRGFSTDRPTKSYLPYTVDAGHFQVETDLAVFAVSNQGDSKIRDWTIVDPTLKIGLTNTTDLEVQVTAHEAVITRNASARSAVSGWGDTYARVKMNLIGDDAGKLAIALLPYVKMPTARMALGNGAVEGGLIVPISVAVPHGFTIVLSPEFDELRNARDRGYHGSANFLVNLSHPVGTALTVYAEVFTTHSFQRADTPIYTLDTAVSLAITHSLQWDMGGNFKVSGQVPDAQIYTGLSRRF